MKKLSISILFIFVFVFVGCGGKTQVPPSPMLADASGVWVGTFTSNDKVPRIATVTINISQGAATVNVSGIQIAPLNAAITLKGAGASCLLVPPFSIPPGEIGSGTGRGALTGSDIDLTFTLNDGGSLRLTGGDNAGGVVKGHLFNGSYQFTGGGCGPQAGIPVLDKQ